jgi:hypothetical protein
MTDTTNQTTEKTEVKKDKAEVKENTYQWKLTSGKHSYKDAKGEMVTIVAGQTFISTASTEDELPNHYKGRAIKVG